MVEPALRLEPDQGNVAFVTAKGKRGASIAKIDFPLLCRWSHAEHVRVKVKSLINLAISVMVHGKVRKNKKIELEIPPGVEDGMTLQLRGEGEPSDGGASGDLLIRIHIRPHPLFERLQDGHLLYNLDLKFTDVALGTEVRVPTLNGQEKLKIPQGTQPNAIFKIKGKGLPRYGGYGKGDLVARINVKIPAKLNDKQKSLLKELDMEFQKE